MLLINLLCLTLGTKLQIKSFIALSPEGHPSYRSTAPSSSTDFYECNSTNNSMEIVDERFYLKSFGNTANPVNDHKMAVSLF